MERLIFHVDVNSAFLSWEAAKRVKEGDPVLYRRGPEAKAQHRCGKIDPGEKIRGDDRGTCGPGTAEMSKSRVCAGGFCAVPEMFPGV